MNTTPYLIFKSHIANKLIDNDLYDQEWFSSQSDRVSMYWNAGESIESAYETIAVFAQAAKCKTYVRDVSPIYTSACIGFKRS